MFASKIKIVFDNEHTKKVNMKWKQNIYPDKNTKEDETNSANNTLTYFFWIYQNIATSGVIGYLPLLRFIFCT